MNKDKEPTKSDQIRELYDRGKSVADIARELNTYYSFVYRVLSRYIKRRPTPLNGQHISKEVKRLWEQNKSLDEIMSALNLAETKRSYIYSMVQKLRREKKDGQRK